MGWIIAGIVIALSGIFLLAMIKGSPEGYQNEDGFFYGKDE